MISRIEYGVFVYRSNTILPMKCSASAYLHVKHLTKYGVVAEVRCRRITYGAWMTPKIRLLNPA